MPWFKVTIDDREYRKFSSSKAPALLAAMYAHEDCVAGVDYAAMRAFLETPSAIRIERCEAPKGPYG